MKEKEVWTLDGRKKIYLVDDNNRIVKEIKDLGPLKESEMQSVYKRLTKQYQNWLQNLDESDVVTKNDEKTKKEDT